MRFTASRTPREDAHTVSPVGKVAESKAANQETHVENGLEHVDPPGVRANQVKLDTTLKKESNTAVKQDEK